MSVESDPAPCPSRVICVLGMHRSGTSCLAGTLEAGGLHLGDVHTHNPFNQRGNRESPRIMALHDRLLAENGFAWDIPPPFGRELTWSEECRRERDAIIEAYSGQPMWGFKDPRTLLALSGWREALPEMETVGIFRHPLAVAGSLRTRGGMSRKAAFAVWMAYNRRLLAEHRARGIPMVSFDRDERGFRAQVSKLGRQLGFKGDLGAADFFAGELRKEGAAPDEAMPEEVAALYGELQAAAIPAAGLTVEETTPRLSIVLVVYNMRREAIRTLQSLRAGYQLGVRAEDYEVLVIDNGSTEPLEAAQVTALGRNFSLHRLDPAPPSPMQAINEGVRLARGQNVGILIDGARMLSPGLVELALRQAPDAREVLTAPTYHLGQEIQGRAVHTGYNEAAEDALLALIGWPHAPGSGHRLFEIACFGGSQRFGLFQPLIESNFLAMPRALFDEMGGYDERFDFPGGGYGSADALRRAAELPGVRLLLAAGEGTFHQFHAGAARSSTGDNAGARVQAYEAQYQALRGGRPCGPPNNPFELCGRVPKEAMRFFALSGELAPQAPEPDPRPRGVTDGTAVAQYKAKNDELRAKIEALKFKNDELRARAEKWKAKAEQRRA